MDIRRDLNPAVQLRCQAWSAELPLGILTNREGLALYDCRLESDKSDGPATARLAFFTCEEHADLEI